MIIRSRDGHLIRSVEDWFRLAPPKKGAAQWKDYRSAKELAKAFLRPRIPDELNALLRSHRTFASLVIDEAVPEYTIPLDTFGGEPRNADLLLVGRTPANKVVVAIEAKADEDFARVIGPYYDSMVKRSSNVPARIEHLARGVFGRPLDEGVRRLRYQLLHGAAATLIEARARGAELAAFVVLEFLSAQTQHGNVARNASDWAHFLSLLGEVQSVRDRLLGPFAVPGGAFVPAEIPLFVGKVPITLP